MILPTVTEFKALTELEQAQIIKLLIQTAQLQSRLLYADSQHFKSPEMRLVQRRLESAAAVLEEEIARATAKQS